MATVSITLPDEHLARVRDALITYLNLDPASTNAQVLAAGKTYLARHIQRIVQSVESEAVREAANEEANAIDASEVAS